MRHGGQWPARDSLSPGQSAILENRLKGRDSLSYANSVQHARSTAKLTEAAFSMRRTGSWIAGVALAGVLATCVEPAQTSGSKNSTKPSEAATTTLSREIHHQILALPFYSVFDSIDFRLEGRKVTLSGQVLRRTLKENAEAAVKSIEGIDAVVNQIEVLPVSPTDDDLRRAVYRALYEDPILERYAVQNVPPVHIIVKNGKVSLEGTVESVSDKHLAGTRAATVPNVAGVKNDLQIHSKENASE
jgi:hyperosmotically inducible periplasmic protein